MIPGHRCNTKAIDSATTSTQFNYGVGFGDAKPSGCSVCQS